MSTYTTEIVGRLVLPGEVVPGRVLIADGRIAEVVADARGADGPYVAPGFVDLHVHGWGGHDAMNGSSALDGMARALLAHGVTTFLPTAVSAPIDELRRFAETVRTWVRTVPDDAALPAGYNLEGPFLAQSRRGAHASAHLRHPSEVPATTIDDLVESLRVITVAPELDGALELIGSLAARGVVVSLGHSDASAEQAAAAYAAGARSTTHLFNAMSGVAHRNPGLAVAALTRDEAAVELIADQHHVHAALWPLIVAAKPSSALLLVSDAISLAGTGDGHARLGELEVEVRGDRSTLAGSDVLAGSVIALDTAIRNMVAAGIALPAAVAAASTNPALLLGLADRGAIEAGRRADIVELNDELEVVGVLREGRRLAGRR